MGVLIVVEIMGRRGVTAIAWILIVFGTLIPSVNAGHLPPLQNPGKYEGQVVWVGELGDDLAVLTSGQGTLLLLISEDGILRKALAYDNFIAEDAVVLGGNLYVLTVDGKIIEINETGGIVGAVKPVSDAIVNGITVAKSGNFLYVLWAGDGLYLSQLLPDLRTKWTVELEKGNGILATHWVGSTFDVIPTPFGAYVLESVPGIFTRLVFVTPSGEVNWSVQMDGIAGFYGVEMEGFVYLIGTAFSDEGTALGIVAFQPNDFGPIMTGTPTGKPQVKFSMDYLIRSGSKGSINPIPESLTLLGENLAILLRGNDNKTYLMEFSKRGDFLRGISLDVKNPGKLGRYGDYLAIASASRDGINVYLLSRDMKLKWARTFMKELILEGVVHNNGYWAYLKTNSWPWGYVVHYSSNGTVENVFKIPEGRVVEGIAHYGGDVYVLLSRNGSETLEVLTEGKSYSPQGGETSGPYPVGGSFLSGTRDGLLVKFHSFYWPYYIESPSNFKELVMPLEALLKGPIAGGIIGGNQTVLWGSGYVIAVGEKKPGTARRYSISGGAVLGAFRFNGTLDVLVESGGMLCLVTVEKDGTYRTTTLGWGGNVSIAMARRSLAILARGYNPVLGINQTKIILIHEKGSINEAMVELPLLGILNVTDSTVVAYGRDGIVEVKPGKKLPALPECKWVEVSEDTIHVDIESGNLRGSKTSLSEIPPEEFYRDAYYRKLGNVTTTKIAGVIEREFKPQLKIVPANGTKVMVRFTPVSFKNGTLLYQAKTRRKSTHGICGPAAFLFLAIAPILRRVRGSQETF